MADQMLNDLMQMGHLIRVNADGSIEDEGLPSNIKHVTPESVDVEVDDDGQILDQHEKDMIAEQGRAGWTFFTKGYSAQYRYTGPIMHPSEFIGGGLERDIREQPGYYVAVPVETMDDDEAPAGWAVLYRES